ncbi:hypothetical protein RJ641_016216 [Dillenia turbinata]|uniref:phosphatidate cytidylyltransferase n=1 Tax=Dillenia turbinata TaxID=194707 RepID=A0AAN8Z0Y6_9MAGN
MASPPSSSSRMEIDRFNLVPLSLTSLCASQTRRPSSSSSKTLILIPQYSRLSLRLVLDDSGGLFRIRSRGGVYKNCRRIIAAVARTQSDPLNEGGTQQEVDKGHSMLMEISDSEHRQKGSQLKRRIIFGLGIGISAGGVVLAGGWVFTMAIAAASFVGAREYFELVRSRGIAAGMTPPPRYVSRVCSVICSLMPIFTLAGAVQIVYYFYFSLTLCSVKISNL